MEPGTRAGVLAGSGTLAFLQCEYPVAKQQLEAALELYVENGDEPGTATVLQRLGSIEREQGRYEAAGAIHRRALALWETLGDETGIATSLDYLGFAAWQSGEFAAALDRGERALERFRAVGRPQKIAACLINLAAAAHYAGDDRMAGTRFEEALSIASDVGYQVGVAWALHGLGLVRGARREFAGAAELMRDSVITHAQLGARGRAGSALDEIAATLLSRRDPERACELIGAADTQREQLGTPVPPAELPALEAALQGLRTRMKSERFEAARQRGRAMSFEEAVTVAVRALDEHYDLDPGGPSRERTGPGPALSERELAVLRLVAEGRTNREIGDALSITPSTAGVHISNILRKLGATRSEAAGLAARLGVLDDQPAAPS